MATFRLRSRLGASALRSGAAGPAGGDTLRYQGVFAPTAAETLTTTDTDIRRNVQARPVPETLVSVDTGVRRNVVAKTAAETLVTAEAATRSTARPRAVPETLVLTDTVVRRNVQARAGAEPTSWSDTWVRDYDPRRALAEQWSTGAAPVLERLAPDYIRTQVHYVGTVAAIQDDPDAPDGSWIVDDGLLGELRVSFPQPSATPATGSGLQEFRIRVRPG
jgi:hypothetical protein